MAALRKKFVIVTVRTRGFGGGVRSPDPSGVPLQMALLRKANFEQNRSAFGGTSSVAIACSTTTDEPVGMVSYLHNSESSRQDRFAVLKLATGHQAKTSA
jgi:hypothetical protein